MSGFDGLRFGVDVLFVPLGIAIAVALTADTVRRIIAAQLAGSIAAIDFVLLAISFRQPSFAELGITAALLSLGGGLLYAHFLERWL